MPTINIFKLEEQEIENCFEKLSKADEQVDYNGISPEFKISFYIYKEQTLGKKVPWSWLLNELNEPSISNVIKAKAVLIIKAISSELRGNVYALTFGNSFFLIDRYCDQNFGFNFASKQKLKGVKLSTLKAPNLRRNKTINSYMAYDDFEISSGNSVAKLKVEAELDDDFDLFSAKFEIGHSIKLNISIGNINYILKSIKYIENVIQLNSVKQKIPVFYKIVNKEFLEDLNNKFEDSVYRNIFLEEEMKENELTIPELEVFGAVDVINKCSDEYELRYSRRSKQIFDLSLKDIKEFCHANQITTIEKLKKIKLVKLEDGGNYPKPLLNFFEFTDDKSQCIYSGGYWYKYNEFYKEYLADSIREIEAYYFSQYDFSKQQKEDYIDSIFTDKKLLTENRPSIERKYYKEFVFNNIICKNDRYDLYDRKDTKVYEKMDIYDKKDKIMFAVKFGKSSSDLCFAVNQSLTSLKEYKNNEHTDFPEIKKVGLWFVLDRKKHLSVSSSNQVELYELEMLMLHNHLDYWKKEVKLNGLIPVVYINYYTNI